MKYGRYLSAWVLETRRFRRLASVLAWSWHDDPINYEASQILWEVGDCVVWG